MYSGSHNDFVVLGDFNFYYDDPSNGVVMRLKAVLQDHDLMQTVDVPTHRRGGHILD